MNFPAGSIGPVLAAVVVRKRRKLIRAFREAGATSAARSQSPADLGLSKNFLFEVQKRRGVLVDAGGGRFYLDEAREAVVKRQRRTVAAVVMVSALLVLAVILMTR